MHPPDLNMLETNSGLRRSDGSFSGKAQATSSNITLAAIGLNLEATEVGGSKDSGAAADAVCGVNLASENIHQHRNGCGQAKGYDYGVGEDEDNDEYDGNYDYNYWHEFVRKYCETDEDNNFEGCPPKGRRGERSDRNGYEHSVWRGGRGQGSGKPASGRGQRSRTTETDINLGVDVVHATPAKDRNQPNHEDNSVYRHLSNVELYQLNYVRLDPRKGKVCTTFETGTVETVDVVAVTPPQQNQKHNRMIEDDDEFVYPPLTEFAKECNSTRACDETHSGDTIQQTQPCYRSR
ncbi:hypothetical protein YC2023_108833 [Brassica napus]|uniref:(rape) hypothetical protein n=1 Tax=Brassica napus TaxID=3708 RepID=A0A816P4C5_BRANA|nr:unnamed protein product [Brassica napus]